MLRRRLSLAGLLLGLIAFCNPGCARANGVNSPIEFGKTASGTLSGTEADTYKFKTKKGGSVVITISEAGPHDDNFVLLLEITGPGNNYMGGGGQPGFHREIMNNVEEGDWSVKITDGGTTGGAYNFTVLRVPGVTGTKVKFGQEYKGTVKNGSLDVYRISGTPGVTVDINIAAANDKFMAGFLFFDPSGANTGGGSCAGECGNSLQMTAYGDYIVMVGAEDSGGPAESPYALSVTRQGETVAAQQPAQASAQLQQAPPSPPKPQAMTVEQVFDNPAAYPIYTRNVVPVPEYPLIYDDDILLTFNADFYVRDQERRMADSGNSLAQLHSGDNIFKTTTKQAVDDFWAKAADQDNVDARNRLGLTYARFHPELAQKYKAADWYSLAVRQGTPDAPVKIANLYHGSSHSQSDEEIVRLATGYAEKGLPDAQYVLGVAYETGQGVKQDYTTAESWYRKAAEQGNRKGEYALANLYHYGHGSLHREGHGKGQVEYDQYFEAVKWYLKASDQGLATAQFRHAAMYLSGYGENRDFVKARVMYESAAEQGLAPAQFNLAVMYATGIGGDPDYIRAGQWYAKAAAQGLMLAQNNLGELIEHGAGFEQDFATAAKWYQLAAATGYPAAQYNLGRLYRDGRGVAKDVTQAVALFTKASAEGHLEAQAEIDELNATAGKLQAYGDAITLLRTAAEKGDNAALKKVVEIYRRGGVKKEDYNDVLALYREAAQRVNPVAFIALADLFAKKDPPDYPEAYYWYRQASVSTEKWHAFPDERDALKKYADGEAMKIAGKLLPEQVAAAQWRIADRSKPAPDKQQLAGAELFIKGDLAEKKGDYYTALQFFMEADSDEVAIAAEELGWFFEHGMGVTRDMSRAIYYFKKAVRNGRIGPATWLGDVYLYGIGVPADMKEAVRWYQMDADRGDPRAVNTLGWIYLFGEKGAQMQALSMYEKAVAHDPKFNTDAYDAIGMIYLYGMGVPENAKESFKWYQKAGDQTGIIQTSWIMMNSDPPNYGSALKLLGQMIDPVMYNDMGYMYERGFADSAQVRRPSQATPTAIELYQQAADMCYGRAMYHIGRLYQSGVEDPAISRDSIPKNPEMARKWMKMAAYYGSQAAADWLDGKDNNDPNPKAAVKPEVHLPAKACQHAGDEP